MTFAGSWPECFASMFVSNSSEDFLCLDLQWRPARAFRREAMDHDP